MRNRHSFDISFEQIDITKNVVLSQLKTRTSVTCLSHSIRALLITHGKQKRKIVQKYVPSFIGFPSHFYSTTHVHTTHTHWFTLRDTLFSKYTASIFENENRIEWKLFEENVLVTTHWRLHIYFSSREMLFQYWTQHTCVASLDVTKNLFSNFHCGQSACKDRHSQCMCVYVSVCACVYTMRLPKTKTRSTLPMCLCGYIACVVSRKQNFPFCTSSRFGAIASHWLVAAIYNVCQWVPHANKSAKENTECVTGRVHESGERKRELDEVESMSWTCRVDLVWQKPSDWTHGSTLLACLDTVYDDWLDSCFGIGDQWRTSMSSLVSTAVTAGVENVLQCHREYENSTRKVRETTTSH